MPHSPHFGHRNFPQKIDFVTFMCLLNPNCMQKKNMIEVMSQSWNMFLETDGQN